MKQIFSFSRTILLLSLLVLGISSVWGDNFSTTYSYGLSDWSLTNYTDQSSYYQVPTGTGVTTSVATISGIFSGKTITSNVVVTINCATYGSGTNPSASTFSLYKETACTNAITATQGGTLPTSSTYTNVTYTITQANAASLGDDLAIKITKPGKTIRLKSIKVEFTYTSGGSTPTKLGTPSNLSATNVTATSATLSWDAVANASSYTVKIGETEYTGVNTNSYSATGLTAGTQYTWTVKAVGDGVNYTTSNYAANANFTTEAEQGGGDDPSGDGTTITFEDLGYASWGKSASFSGSTYDELSQTKSNVVFDYTRGSGSTYANTTSIRFYKDNQLKFTAPDGYKITSIVWTGSAYKNDVTTNVVTCTSSTSALSWAGSAESVTFTRPSEATSYITLSAVAVTLKKNGDDPDPEKTVTGISVSGTPAEFWKGDAFNHDGITVTATWSDDTQTDVTSSCTFTGYNMSTPGEQTVTVTYQEETCQYSIEIKTIANTQETAYTVAEAKALIDAGKDLATKVYVKGIVSQIDSYNSTYKSITYWISADGTTTNQFEVYSGKSLNNTDFSAKEDLTVGDDVTVYGVIKKYNSTYEFDNNNYLVEWNKVATLSIADITVANGEDITPVITTNVTGEYAIEYTSDNEEVVLATDDEMVTMGTGTATITATLTADGYKTVETTFTVTVTDASATITSVTLSGELTKTAYTIGDAFDHTGLVATANYSDGTNVDVTEIATWEVDPETLTTAGTVTVTVSASYEGQEDIQEYEVTVNKKTATLSFAPATIEVEIGKDITLEPTTTPADAEISYTITAGSENISINNGVVTGVAEGSATIRADYAGNDEYDAASTTVTINVIPADESTTVTQTGFSATSGTLTDDVNGEDTNLSYVAEKGDASTVPAINSGCIRLYQNGGKITIKGVKGVHISSASLTTGSTYATTTIAHVADPNNNTKTPTNGTSVAKNTTYTASGLNCNSITFYCLGADKNTRLDVAILSVKYTKEVIELSSIALSGTYKTEFVQNSTFNHDGVVVTATYSDDDTQVVTANAVFSEPDMTTTGTKTVTVSYTEGDVTKTATYDITVVDEAVTAIKLSGEYQTTFRAGETFNHDNLVVKADYNSGRTNVDVTSNAEVSEPDMSTTGEKIVTVSFGGQEETYTIKVIPANAIFYESFNQCMGTGANDGQWSGSIASSTLKADNENWTFVSGNGANKCAKFGAGSTQGSAQTPAIAATGGFKLTFKAAAWNGNSEATTLNISATDATVKTTSVTLAKGEWTEYTVYIVNATNGFKVKFEAAQASNNRFFLDEILIVETNKLNLVATDGNDYYATFSSTRAVEFTENVVYTVSVSGSNISLDEVASKQVPANTGVLIKSAVNSVEYTFIAEADALDANNRLMPGAATVTAVAGHTYYRLAYYTGREGLGFYYVKYTDATKTAFYSNVGGAYLDVETPMGSAPVRFVFGTPQTPTDIENLNGETMHDEPMKVLINGQVFILRGEKLYDTLGHQVK